MKNILILFAFLSSTAAKSYEGDQVITFTISHVDQLDFLEDIADIQELLDFWRPTSVELIKPGLPTDVRIPRDFINTVKTALEYRKIDFDVKIEDVQELIENTEGRTTRNRRTLKYNYYRYHTFDEIDQWVDDIANEYPSIARSSVLGTTTERRSIKKLTIGASENNTQILIDCGIHAREWIAPAFCQCYVYRLLSYYGKDKDITKMLDELTFVVIPVLNPDGYAFTQKDRMWRKTRSPIAGSYCYGVDANRNFDADWRGPGSSHHPCSEIYHGPKKNSEPLTQALTKYIDDNKGKIKAYITFHSYGQVFVFPYSYAVKRVDNYIEHETVARAAANAMYNVYRARYTYGPGYQSMYLAAGGSDDMAKDHGVNLVYTIELRDLGRYGFLLPEIYIAPVCLETFAGMDVIAKHIMENYQNPQQSSTTHESSYINRN